MRAFTAMPFSNNFHEHWSIIKEIATKRNIEVFRVDQELLKERYVNMAICREIRASDFLIALLIGDKDKNILNPNVAFEIGYAQGIGMETILLAEELEHLPCDFQQQRICLYHGDFSQLREGLDKEFSMLKFWSIDSYRAKTKYFFGEITRCLHLTLPSQYRDFKEEVGYFNNTLFYSIYYKEKYNFRYITYINEYDQIIIACWLNNQSLRIQQKDFFRNHQNYLQERFGHDVIVSCEEKFSAKEEHLTLEKIQSQINDARVETYLVDTNTELQNIEFIKVTLSIKIDKRNVGTREALQIALHLVMYVEILEPLNRKFQETHGKDN